MDGWRMRPGRLSARLGTAGRRTTCLPPLKNSLGLCQKAGSIFSRLNCFSFWPGYSPGGTAGVWCCSNAGSALLAFIPGLCVCLGLNMRVAEQEVLICGGNVFIRAYAVRIVCSQRHWFVVVLCLRGCCYRCGLCINVCLLK